MAVAELLIVPVNQYIVIWEGSGRSLPACSGGFGNSWQCVYHEDNNRPASHVIRPANTRLSGDEREIPSSLTALLAFALAGV